MPGALLNCLFESSYFWDGRCSSPRFTLNGMLQRRLSNAGHFLSLGAGSRSNSWGLPHTLFHLRNDRKEVSLLRRNVWGGLARDVLSGETGENGVR